jgi:hypothetical protein
MQDTQPGLGAIPIVGQKTDAEFKAYVDMLYKHLDKKHPEIVQQGANYMGMFMPFLILSAFETQDPEVQKRYDAHRIPIRRLTQSATFSDEAINTLVSTLQWMEPEGQKQVADLMRKLQDALLEREPAAQPDPSRLVTV